MTVTLVETTVTSVNVTSAPDLFGSISSHERHYIGMALALGGNLLISISLSVQKNAHNRLGQNSQTKYCVDKWWWFGMVLMGLGEVGNFMAYGFAPASLVAPLGSVAVIANTIIASIFLKEPLTMPSMLGVTLVIVGSIILFTFSLRTRPILTSETIISFLKAWPFLLYIVLEFFLLLLLLYLKYRRGMEHMVILLLLVAVVASVTIIASKALSTLVTESALQKKLHILNPVFFVCLFILPLTTVVQIRFLNRAMQLYDVSDVVPVNYIFFTVSAILAGAMFYQEFYGVYFDRIFMFLYGCVLGFIGVWIITQQKEDNNQKILQRENFPIVEQFIGNHSEYSSLSDTEVTDLASPSSVNNSKFVLSHDSDEVINRKNLNNSSEHFYENLAKSFKRDENVAKVQPLLK